MKVKIIVVMNEPLAEHKRKVKLQSLVSFHNTL